MLGSLLMTFLDKSGDAPLRWLELWGYPDGTLNLVIASDEEGVDVEYHFPCAPYHLREVVEGCPFQVSSKEGFVLLDRKDEHISASFQRSGEQGWQYAIPISDFRSAVDELSEYAYLM